MIVKYNNKVRVRDLVQHLQTLPQDMEMRLMVENNLTTEQCFLDIDDVEIHEMNGETPDAPWNNKVVVIKGVV